jgi:hypothetical protein
MPVFKSPVGNKLARDAGQIWPVPWEDKNPYGNIYTINSRTARHPGADLNIASGDLNEKVFAIGPGIVKFAKEIGGDSLWGNVVIIYHGVVDGKPLYSRYAHLLFIEPHITNTKDAEVTADTPIGSVGSGPAGSGMDPHLHFDISTTEKLAENAGDWPGMNEARLLTDYVNPKDWLKSSHVINKAAKGNLVGAEPSAPGVGSKTLRIPDMPAAASIIDWFVIARPNAELRKELSKPTGNTLPFSFSFPLEITPQLVLHEEFFWVQICDGPLKGHWVKYGNESKSELYVSSTRPSP